MTHLKLYCPCGSSISNSYAQAIWEAWLKGWVEVGQSQRASSSSTLGWRSAGGCPCSLSVNVPGCCGLGGHMLEEIERRRGEEDARGLSRMAMTD